MANAIPSNDFAFKAWLAQFHAACSGNLTVLGITSPQLTALYDALQTFDTNLTDHVAKRAASAAQTDYKDAAKQAAKDNVSHLIKIIRTRDVPSGLLTDLGIGPVDPHHPVQPEQPGTLTVTPYAIGTNWLRWERGTNKRGTQYVVQVLNADTGGWIYLGTTLKTNYRHTDQQPGFQQSYRVMALRNGHFGTPTFPATVYGPEAGAGEAPMLKVA